MILALDADGKKLSRISIKMPREILTTTRRYDIIKLYYSLLRKGRKYMKVTLPSGLILEGDTAEVARAANALGFRLDDGVHYNSASRGRVEIREMTTPHIMNAIRKIYRAWADDLNTAVTAQQFFKVVHDGPRDNVTLLGLLAELKKR